jgi:tyrosyl-tRNA synthetase
MKLSEDLAWRGLIKDKTFSDKAWLDKPQSFYHGVDASENSLHIGNLAALFTVRRFIDSGWKAVLLAGGATSLVGDPGGKLEERQLKSRETIKANVESIKRQISSLFAGVQFAMVDNYDWFRDVGYLEFLREIGKHYSMTELMQRDFVTERMGEGGRGISYAEFSYSLIQGYDYWQLYKNHDVVLQIGGSDQWGNMLSGVPLIRKKENAEVHALSMPLVINKSTGRKFGKSELGTIWLNPEKTSPTQFYQFWINVDDGDIEDFLKIFTFLQKSEIESLIQAHHLSPHHRNAQKALAREVTKLVHGQKAVQFAENITGYLTGDKPITDANPAELKEVRQALPNLAVHPGEPVIDALVKTGLAASNSEARRLVQEKAVYVNSQKFNKDHLDSNDFKNGRLMLRRGKAFKDSALIELQ